MPRAARSSVASTKLLGVRLTADEHEAVMRTASTAGYPDVSTYVRALLLADGALPSPDIPASRRHRSDPRST
jgi:hypothetical protein